MQKAVKCEVCGTEKKTDRERANARQRRWAAKNPEKAKEASRRWAAKNPDKLRDMRRRAKRKWKAKNPEKVRAEKRRYYAKRKLLEKRDWKAGPVRRYQRTGLTGADAHREANRRYRANNPEKLSEQRARDRLRRDPAKIRAHARRCKIRKRVGRDPALVGAYERLLELKRLLTKGRGRKK